MKATEANLLDLMGVTKTRLYEGGRKAGLSLTFCQCIGESSLQCLGYLR